MPRNNNVTGHQDPEQNRQLLARLWDGVERRGDGKCYCPCSRCRGFNMRRLLIKICNDIHESNHAMKDIIENLNNDEEGRIIFLLMRKAH